MRVGVARALVDSSDFELGSKVHKMGDSRPWTPMNRRAKFDAARLVLVGEIRSHTKNEHTNSNRYIHHTLLIGMCG